MEMPDLEALEIVASYVEVVNHLFKRDYECNDLEDIAGKYQEFRVNLKTVSLEMELMNKEQRLPITKRIENEELKLYSLFRSVVNRHGILSEDMMEGGYKEELDIISKYHSNFNDSLKPTPKRMKKVVN